MHSDGCPDYSVTNRVFLLIILWVIYIIAMAYINPEEIYQIIAIIILFILFGIYNYFYPAYV